LISPLRAALFTDCFSEANGVAALGRRHAAFANRRQLPFLCAVYSPQWRCRRDRSFRIGYVGRLTQEKNVRLFADLERSPLAQSQRDFRFTLIGEGNQRDWLRKNPEFGQTPGILRGEAPASGVPLVVSPETRARVGMRHGVTGFYAPDLPSFTESVRQLTNTETPRQRIGAAARAFTCAGAWNDVFEQWYQTYERGLEAGGCKPSDRAIAESQTTS
jgi:glycosyltransferase involved in cell wall biosynthesis